MQGAGRITKLALALAVGSMIAAASARAADSGVTLINDGGRPLDVYVRYGGEGDCSIQSKSEKVSIAAGQSQTIDAPKVCLCLTVPEHNTCPAGWSEVQGGSKRRFR